MRKKVARRCKCVEQVNAKLVDRNAKIEQRILLDFGSGNATVSAPCIATEKLDNRKRARLPAVIASYCPFCGRKWQ